MRSKRKIDSKTKRERERDHTNGGWFIQAALKVNKTTIIDVENSEKRLYKQLTKAY